MNEKDYAAQRAFGDFIRSQGLDLVGDPEMDGQIHRLPVIGGKHKKKDGAYKGFLDAHPAGWVRNFRNGGDIEPWRAERSQRHAPEELAALRAAVKEKQANRAAETLAKEVAVANAARALWAEAPVATAENAYLRRKGISDPSLLTGLRTVPTHVSQSGEAHGIKIARSVKESIALRTEFPESHVFTAGDLLVPATDGKGNVWVLQSISPNFKSWMKGGRKHGNFLLLGEPTSSEPILVAEGYATAASIAMASQPPVSVAVAFDAYNLDTVVGQLKALYPNSPVGIMADNDQHRKDGLNPGLERATAAGKVHGVAVVPPRFRSDDTLSTDFNDLHAREGLEVARLQVTQALALAQAYRLAQTEHTQPTPKKESKVNPQDIDAAVQQLNGIEAGPPVVPEPRPADLTPVNVSPETAAAVTAPAKMPPVEDRQFSAAELLVQVREAVNQRHADPSAYRRLAPDDAIAHRSQAFAAWHESVKSDPLEAQQLQPELARHWAVADLLSLEAASPAARALGVAAMSKNVLSEPGYADALADLDPKLHSTLLQTSAKEQLAATEADVRKTVSLETMKAQRAELVQESPAATERLRLLLPAGDITEVTTERITDPAHGALIALRAHLSSGTSHHVAFVDTDDQASILQQRILKLAAEPKGTPAPVAQQAEDGFSAGPDWRPRPPGDDTSLSKLIESVTYKAQQDGSVLYMVNSKPAFIDHGDRFLMNPKSSMDEEFILAAVHLAKEKYGGSFQLTGSEEFKRRAMEVIAKHDVKVTLKDPQQHAALQTILSEKTRDNKLPQDSPFATPAESAKELLARAKSQIPEAQEPADLSPAPSPQRPAVSNPRTSAPTGPATQEQDPLYGAAMEVARTHQAATAALIQRELHIGYNRAARILEQMEVDGVVSSPSPTGKRSLLSGLSDSAGVPPDGMKVTQLASSGTASPEIETLQPKAMVPAKNADDPARLVPVPPELAAAEKFVVGRVIAHGPAPYEHNQNNDPSYFVKLQTTAGVKEIWGKDLANAMEKGKVKPGEHISLSSSGTEPVTVRVKDLSPSGAVQGEKEISAHRRAWDASRLEPLLVAPTDDRNATSAGPSALFAVPGENRMQGVLMIDGKPQSVVAEMTPRRPDPDTGEIRSDYIKLFAQSETGALREVGHGNAVNHRPDGRPVHFDEVLLKVGTEQIALRVSPSLNTSQHQWLGFREPVQPRTHPTTKPAADVGPKPLAAVAEELPAPEVATNNRRTNAPRMRA